MKELSKEELIKWHKRIWKTRISFGDRVFFEEEQAYKQIHQLIESQPEVTRKFVEKWFDKINYGIPVGSTIPITCLIDFLKEAGVKIKEEE